MEGEREFIQISPPPITFPTHGEEGRKPKRVRARKRKKEAPHAESRFPHPPTGARGSVSISMQPRVSRTKI